MLKEYKGRSAGEGMTGKEIEEGIKNQHVVQVQIYRVPLADCTNTIESIVILEDSKLRQRQLEDESKDATCCSGSE